MPTEPEHKSTPILAKVINLGRMTYISQYWDRVKPSLPLLGKNMKLKHYYLITWTKPLKLLSIRFTERKIIYNKVKMLSKF